ncbi:MAG: hypothetical protein QUS35_05225 [bacterium]|nr:hypothetical protein [bacterium]
MTPSDRSGTGIRIRDFGVRTREDKALLRRFVDFHWDHYRDDPSYVPLLDYEYLGFPLLGIRGFFEESNLFLRHAEMRFFLAEREGQIVGRCNAFVNRNHNRHWNDKTGFFGQFEAIEDPQVCAALTDAAAAWLRGMGMTAMRGPQNLPVNEATPGILTAGFESRPVMYYHYGKPWYAGLLSNAGFRPVKKVVSWEAPVQRPMEDKLVRLSEKIIERYGITVEPWGARPLKERKAEMLEVYNDAWSDNFGFVPFEPDEFYRIVDDMQLIMDKKLFLFLYVKGELAAFFGGVPNVVEHMKPARGFARRWELVRALRMILGAKRTEGFRLGYLGVKKKFRRLGLDGVMIWVQKRYAQKKGYQYCDLGWMLEDNVMVLRLGDLVGGHLSKTYTIYEKPIA